jgi:hypothetical protein
MISVRMSLFGATPLNHELPLIGGRTVHYINHRNWRD